FLGAHASWPASLLGHEGLAPQIIRCPLGLAGRGEERSGMALRNPGPLRRRRAALRARGCDPQEGARSRLSAIRTRPAKAYAEGPSQRARLRSTKMRSVPPYTAGAVTPCRT